MDIKALDLTRSAFGATGLSPVTFMSVETAHHEPVDRVERSAPSPASHAADAPAPAPPAPAPPAPPAPSPTVKVRYNPQDVTVMPDVDTSVPRSDIGTNMSNARMQMSDKNVAKPDADGNYLFSPGTAGYQQATSFVSTEKTLRMFEKALGHEIKWAFSGKLAIHPHAGEDFNAYYTRSDGSTNFFDGKDPIRKKTCYSAESMDVVSHETGHAILDGLKPGLMGWFSGTEAGALHESFGDMAGMLTSLQDDAVVEKLAAQTGGNLKKDNFLAHVGEDLSLGINNAYFNGQKPAGWTIRNANNSLVYKNPKDCPSNPSDENQLGSEVHNFSRLLTGAFWDILNGLTAQEMAAGKTPADAIRGARDVATKLVARMAELGPNSKAKFVDEANAMIAADKKDFGGAHVALLSKVFADRKIRSADDAGSEVPKLKLAQSITSDGQAADFLAANREALGVASDVPLKPAARWSNDKGESFVRYDYTQDAEVGPSLVTQLGGSLTVAFDADGTLFHKSYEPVDAEAVALAKDQIATLIEQGDIRGAGITRSTRPDGRPWAGYIELSATGDRRIVRNPVATEA
ncbi:MAG: hypothetical protein EB084_16180 [Proteobacteria bacterium]|nr:hypothetical protein [Pseudomonadota bacterium]